MRPGPGLVVMALAFISGARRGSSTSQKQQEQQQHHHNRQQQQQQLHQQHLTIYPNIYDNLKTTYNNNNHNYLNYNYISNNNNFVTYNKLGKIGYDNDEENYGGTGGTTSALGRVNPWLSACDLEQPNQAPDLQGQCSAGTLPVAWVDEGPGPPRCPLSCERLRLDGGLINNRFKDNKYNNKLINYKTNGNQLPRQKTMTHETQHQQFQQKAQHQPKHQQQQQSQQQQQQHQCLDYLGDNEQSSPAQLCKKSRNLLAEKLRLLRMRHCCERTVFSALHTLALNATLNGGVECIRTLNDLMDMDALATRITCEFTEILVRYDCRQPYSLIHHCEDCKEAYRRWVCSTLIPYYAEPEDIRQNTTTSNSINKTENHSAASPNLYHVRTGRSTSISDNANNSKKIVNNSENVKRRTNSETNMSQSISTVIVNPIDKDPLLDRLLKRTKRKSQIKRRKRLRPCLSVCQTVEQKCPYMLPGDRAPAYPTQYAGEPTFLCLDRNIPETGDQLRKSNNGPENCCYRYCDTPADGICAYCDPFFSSPKRINTTDKLPSLSSLSSSSLLEHFDAASNALRNDSNTSKIVNIGNIYYYDDYDDAMPTETVANCQNLHTATPTSSHPCTIPYYASSSIKLVSMLLSYRCLVLWTVLWCLVNISTTNSNWTKNDTSVFTEHISRTSNVKL